MFSLFLIYVWFLLIWCLCWVDWKDWRGGFCSAPCCACWLGVAAGEAAGELCPLCYLVAKQWHQLSVLQREGEAEGVHPSFGWVCVAGFTAIPQHLQFKLYPSSSRWQWCLALEWGGGCPQPHAWLCLLGPCLHRCLVPLPEKVSWVGPGSLWGTDSCYPKDFTNLLPLLAPLYLIFRSIF